MMVGRTSFENIKTLMTLPTSMRDADDYVSHPRISELTARSYVGGVEYTFKVSHNVELNMTMMNEYNDGDGYKRRMFMSLVSQQWQFSSSAVCTVVGRWYRLTQRFRFRENLYIKKM